MIGDSAPASGALSRSKQVRRMLVNGVNRIFRVAIDVVRKLTASYLISINWLAYV